MHHSQVVDVVGHAVWWEPGLQQEIVRAGNRIIAFHVSYWLTDTSDVRLERAMPGDGLIDLPLIRRWVEAAEYRGPIEVQLCSQRDWWTRDADVVVQTMLCKRCCADDPASIWPRILRQPMHSDEIISVRFDADLDVGRSAFGTSSSAI